MIDHTDAVAKSGLGGELAMLVDGEMCAAQGGATLSATDPSTGDRLATFPNATAADVDRAVVAARRAFDAGPWPGWFCSHARPKRHPGFPNNSEKTPFKKFTGR